MANTLGRGLSALINDRSGETGVTIDRFGRIRELERKLDSLQDEINVERRKVEELRKNLTIELMLKGKVEKEDLLRMEEALEEKIKEKDRIIREIGILKEEARSYNPSSSSSEQPGTREMTPRAPAGDENFEEIDMRMLKELVPKGEKEPLNIEEPPTDDEYINGLREELDRTRTAEVIRREVYGDDPPTAESMKRPMVRRVKRAVSPKKIRILKGATQKIARSRDERMYELIQKALDRMSDGDFIVARGMLEEVLDEYPDDDEVLYHIGNTFYMEGDLLTAEVYFSRSADLNPDSYRAHNNLGVVQKDLGKKEFAIRELNLAIELNPRYDRAWFNLGILFMEIQPPLLREASIFLKRAIEMKPDFAKAREKLHECRMMISNSR